MLIGMYIISCRNLSHLSLLVILTHSFSLSIVMDTMAILMFTRKTYDITVPPNIKEAINTLIGTKHPVIFAAFEL